ncbi:MAG: superoxide dismutase [Pseudomonadales bacterium]|jgi:Fe-Mn family superoxide dismutase
MKFRSACLSILCAIVAFPAHAESFKLEPLPYAYDALAPVIGAETMQIHHGRHHQAYVDNLNKAVAAEPSLSGKSLMDLIGNLAAVPEAQRNAVRNNGGGHWNHTFFWASMAAISESGSPSAELMAAIERDFGSFEAFKTAFNGAGASRFGSGWVWLVADTEGRLKVISTPNQDNPIMDIAPERGTPLLGNDVWEHAYYLNYQNRRADYLTAWWQVVNWSVVSARFAALTP